MNPAESPIEIEVWLLGEGRWVPAAEICHRFEVTERALRARDGKPGLMDAFAVSSDAGYKHVRLLSTEDFLQVASRVLRHGGSEIRKVRTWRKARRNQLTGTRTTLREAVTGQGVLL